MTFLIAALLPAVLSATIDVPAGAELAAALGRASPGDVVRLGAGEHRGGLGRLRGIRVEGAGPERTTVVAAEGEDGASVVDGEAALEGLTLRAGRARCGLAIAGGAARLRDVALAGGACGALVSEGRLDGAGVDLLGEHGLLVRRGEVTIDGGTARGSFAGVAVLSGRATLRRFSVTGPFLEAAVSVGNAAVTLEAVVIRAPGPSGIALAPGGTVVGLEVTVAGATSADGIQGDCAQVRRGTLRLTGGTLLGCAGAAVESSGGTLALRGVDAAGGEMGCLVFVNDASVDLDGNLCAGRGPGLVAASGTQVAARMNRWWTDPVFWVDCGAGARLVLGPGEKHRAPCAP